jgi:hypothetical protein
MRYLHAIVGGGLAGAAGAAFSLDGIIDAMCQHVSPPRDVLVPDALVEAILDQRVPADRDHSGPGDNDRPSAARGTS